MGGIKANASLVMEELHGANPDVDALIICSESREVAINFRGRRSPNACQ